MCERKIVQHCLTTLSKRLHLNSLELNDKNECYLVFDQKLHVRITYIENKKEVTLYSRIGNVPKYSLNAYIKILSDNFFWVGTAGSKLILEPIGSDNEDSLALKDSIPMSIMDDDMLYERMEDFVNAVEYWDEQYPKFGFNKNNKVDEKNK